MKTSHRSRQSSPISDRSAVGFRASSYEPQIAQLVFRRSSRFPSTAALTRIEREAANQGFTELVTTALAPAEQKRFIELGYSPMEQLTVLSKRINRQGTSALHATRDALEIDLDEILEIDKASFNSNWVFDINTIRDALNATPHSRFRITEDAQGITGYAITGRSGRNGYLQRLAVAPRARHRSFARSLIVDSMKWLNRWWVKSAAVNTQVGNIPAQSLYQSFGFSVEDYQLAILKKRIA